MNNLRLANLIVATK